MQTPVPRPRTLSSALVRAAVCAFVFVGVFAAVHQPDPAPKVETDVQPVVAHASYDLPEAVRQAKPNGEKLYLTRCMSCHQATGQGVPGTFPPLVDSEWVTGDEGRIVRVILHGLSGEIMVGDKKYNGAMPGWGTFMNDAEVAALVTYVRNAWGNEASEVSAAQVKAVRAAHADRKKAWTAAELEQPANIGIPGQKSGGSK